MSHATYLLSDGPMVSAAHVLYDLRGGGVVPLLLAILLKSAAEDVAVLDPLRNRALADDKSVRDLVEVCVLAPGSRQDPDAL